MFQESIWMNVADVMRNADPRNFVEELGWLERMKIVTDKGKYLVRGSASTKEVYGNEWSSPELGQFLLKCGFGEK